MQRKIFHFCRDAAFFYRFSIKILLFCYDDVFFVVEFRDFFDAAFLTRDPHYFAC